MARKSIFALNSLLLKHDVHYDDAISPADFKFAPLGLGKDPAFLKLHHEAELIHKRWAMAVVLGIFVGQAWSGIPLFEADANLSAITPFSAISSNTRLTFSRNIDRSTLC
jgi:hypothetical protein